MRGSYRKHIILIVAFILATLHKPSMCQGYSLKYADKKDVIDIISEKHIEIARCRLFCFKELMGPRLLYENIDSVSYECKNTSISCNHCYEMCEKIAHDKKDEMTVCNYENHMCFGGCRTACKHRFLSNKELYQPNLLEQDGNDIPEIVVANCILYWHFHKPKHSATNLVMYQIYGKDSSNTWFDMGQTTKSYFEHLPSIIDKCKAILILSIDEFTSKKLEYDLNKTTMEDKCNVKKVTKLGNLQDIVKIRPLFHSSLDQVNETFSNFTLKVVIVLVLCLLLLLLILLCVVVYRIKLRRNRKLNSSSNTVVTENSYEEIDIPNLQNFTFGAYNVKKGQITSIMNNNYSETALAVALPNERNSNKLTNTRNVCDQYEDRIPYFEKENIDNDVANHKKEFVDVVSWLRTVNSEMRFDNFGFNNKERQPYLNVYPLNYFHVEMSPKL